MKFSLSIASKVLVSYFLNNFLSNYVFFPLFKNILTHMLLIKISSVDGGEWDFFQSVLNSWKIIKNK